MKTSLIRTLLCIVGMTIYQWSSAQSGCTNPLSCNFDAAATVDDGSCYSLPEDLNCNNMVDVLDYLILMDHINCVVDPQNSPIEVQKCDFDENLTVGVSDLIILISHYGEIHPGN